MSPLLSFGAAWRSCVLIRRLRREPGPEAERVRVPGWWLGAAAAAVAIGVVALPPVLTRYWSRQVAAGGVEERRTALQRLRSFGQERTLLADCYGAMRGESEGVFGVYPFGAPPRIQEARDNYYRVTGRAFNADPPPQALLGARGWDALDEFSWDSDQGGTAVGGRLKGLSLAQSRLDGMLDADAAWSYLEWTFEFKNVADQPREARAQIGRGSRAVVRQLASGDEVAEPGSRACRCVAPAGGQPGAAELETPGAALGVR